MSRAVTGILLAAGSSSRFGTDKLLHPLVDGTPVALAAARQLQQVLPDSLAVVRDANDAVARLLAGTGLRLVVNARAGEGMGGSIASAVQHCRGSAAWVIALADMPWLSADSIARVVSRLAAGADLVAPVYRKQRGHPVGFSTRHGDALSVLSGDEGARRLLATHAATLELVEVEDPGVCLDIDTQSDLEPLVNRPPPG